MCYCILNSSLFPTCLTHLSPKGTIRPTMDNMLDLLNPQQQIAVATPPGPTLVLAGPGSGKTRVLTYRIAYLIGVLNIPPHNILAVTFTNKAAKEMGARVEKIIGPQAQGIWLGTFHAICGRILRREADLLPVDHNFVIFDEDDQKSLMKTVLKEFNADEKIFKPGSVLDAISNAKNDLLSPQDFPIQDFRDEQIRKFYTRYQQLLVRNNAMDFDDMLVYTAHMLEEIEIVRNKYAHRFEHVLVDEFQDTNQAQYVILYQLASHHRNLYVVGDEDQSIYRWRGADYRNIQRFERDFKEHKKILLEQNYRSTQTILDAAVAVIDRNPNRTSKKLFTDIKKGEKAVLYEAVDDHEEAAYVVETIERLISSHKAKPSDFAIMYRTNAQSRLLEEAFRRAGMNYRLVGAQRFYGRREVRDAIAFLRLIYNPKDDVSLARVINLPPRGIGDKSIEKLNQVANDEDLSSSEVLLDLALGEQSSYRSFFGRESERLAQFGKMLSVWRAFAEEASLSELFDLVVQSVDYHTYINDRSAEGLDRWENVMELRTVILEYESQGLAEFLEAMALVADQDTLPEIMDAPTMLTLHAAKGLEFERVFIIGLDEMLLPHSRSRDDAEALSEERRLFYVGITRAKQKLTLVRAARRRSSYGSYEETQPSRFLDDLPDHLLEGRPRSYTSRLSSYKDLTTARWQVPAYRVQNNSKAAVEKKYSTGMQVRHPVYGRGVVRISRLEFGDETVEVYFENIGLKALVASLANLEIL
jgi:DNA helicase-2/ATP-dependent DNA helicase PcrA